MNIKSFVSDISLVGSGFMDSSSNYRKSILSSQNEVLNFDQNNYKVDLDNQITNEFKPSPF